MRLVIILVALLVCGAALAVDLNSSDPVKFYYSGGHGVGSGDGGYAVLDSVSNGASFSEFEQWYLFQSQASEDVRLRRYFEGAWEDIGVTIPSGKSLVINVPYTNTKAASGYSHQLVWFSAVTDSVEIIPWQR